MPISPTIPCARLPTRLPPPSRKRERVARSCACGTAHESRPPASAGHPTLGAGTIAQSARTEYAREVHLTYARAIKKYGPPEDTADCDTLAELDEVRVNYAEDVRDDLAAIAKDYRLLVSDPRMRGVWRELSRQSNGGFLHPACAPLTQEAALIEVFDLALECRKRRWPSTTRGEVEERRRHFLAKAEKLEDDAWTMMAHPLLCRGMDFLPLEQRGELGQRLMRAADACK